MERQFVTPSGTQPGRGVPPDDTAAERLYSEYSERLLAFCFKQLRSRAEAEDAVQITFLCALRALRRGVVPESESAWLHAIARNVCRWQQRTASRRPVSSNLDVDSVAVSANDEETGRLAGLREALESLPERQRQALLLREWRGLSAPEIAEYLHLSPPATHALLTRARRSLAHALTAPQRAALGVASLVYELRSWLKATLGGASAKVAVATVAVVGTGVGGVVVDQSIAGDRESRQPAESAQPAPAGPVGGRVGVASRTTAVGSSAGGPVTAPGARGVAPRESGLTSFSGRRPASRPAQTMRGRTRPDATAEPGSIPAPTPRVPDTPGTDPLAGVSVDPLPPELPPVELPPVDLPPVEVPPVDLPPVELPPVDVPTDVIPPTALPPIDPPPVPPLP
jgi:RNA polymerase sigma-70 factor (ECF subfamily)